VLNNIILKEILPYMHQYSTYPGEFIPLPQAEVLLQQANEGMGSKPLVNLEENPDCYKVEVNVPGAKREDIFISVNDRILSIIVLRMACENLQHSLQLHEFDNRPIKRQVYLPTNADTEFISAEYKEGIVYLHLPKSQQHPVLSIQRIAVY
jgi:HSP20 family protein